MPARPDRPLSALQRPLREAVRSIRRLRHKALLGPRLQLGENVIIGAHSVLLPPTRAAFGDNVAIGRGFHLEANIEVGPDVLISSNVAIVGNDHRIDDASRTVFDSGRLAPSNVRIEGDNLIGYGTTIVGDVTIGRGCVVGARSVVTRDLPAYWICFGVPAVPQRPRYPAARDA